MKKGLLFLSFSVIIGIKAIGQLMPSDAPSLQAPVMNSGYAPEIPTTYTPEGGPNVNVLLDPGCDTVQATFQLGGYCNVVWWDAPVGGNNLGNGDMITTTVTSDQLYYFQTGSPDSTNSTTIPAQNGTFSGNVRGYWFTSPIDFTISGVYVPLDAGTGAPTASVVRFNSGPPPLYSVTTNDFLQLGYWVNHPEDTIFTCIQVHAGDVIGVLGYRNTNNSYATPGNMMLNGNAIPIERLGMQYNLTTTAPQELWTESGGSISRVELLYDMVSDTTARTSFFVDIPNSYSNAVLSQVCQGDSILLDGNYYSTDTNFTFTGTTVLGCDSSIYYSLTVNPLPAIQLNGSDTLYTCSSDSISLPVVSPLGGVWSGDGVNGNVFDPLLASTDTVSATYSYTDTNGCSNTTEITLIAVSCFGTENPDMHIARMYPNPTTDFIQLVFSSELKGEGTVSIIDPAGRTIQVHTIQAGQNQSTLSVENLKTGTYFLTLDAQGVKSIQKFVKN